MTDRLNCWTNWMRQSAFSDVAHSLVLLWLFWYIWTTATAAHFLLNRKSGTADIYLHSARLFVFPTQVMLSVVLINSVLLSSLKTQ